MRDLVLLVQVNKREKHPWRSVDFTKVARWSLQLKVTLLHGCFSRFSDCTNCTKSRKASRMVVWILSCLLLNKITTHISYHHQNLVFLFGSLFFLVYISWKMSFICQYRCLKMEMLHIVLKYAFPLVYFIHSTRICNHKLTVMPNTINLGCLLWSIEKCNKLGLNSISVEP